MNRPTYFKSLQAFIDLYEDSTDDDITDDELVQQIDLLNGQFVPDDEPEPRPPMDLPIKKKSQKVVAISKLKKIK